MFPTTPIPDPASTTVPIVMHASIAVMNGASSA